MSSPYLLTGALEHVGNGELGLKFLAVEEELVAELDKRLFDVEADEMLRGDAIVYQLSNVLPKTAADIEVSRVWALKTINDRLVEGVGNQCEIGETVEPNTGIGVGFEAPFTLYVC
ncbi:hypothetical protein RRF57_011555 [Xylaria bambusicola]|uniref:Uncharacterized protein n=1 Tax=Xylaria bambusicola TaxID=326684 RepID=A0AAN7UWX8_9PEZI